jgi:hypothetical protein
VGNVIGGLLVAIGMLGMFGIWIYTSVVFFASGETVLGLISLLVPPADIVLPFLISPALGFAGIGAMVLAFAGFALRRD